MSDAIHDDQFLIIIGAAKCATTSLFDYLSQHPAICPSVTKEPDYFLEHRRRFQNVRRYDEFWPDFDRTVHHYALEGSTHYSMRYEQGGVPERMRAYGIQPRFIYVVRDPVKRIESHVNYVMMYSRESVSFNDPGIIDASRYADQLQPYVNTFGADSIKVVDFKELSSNPNQVCANLYAWLGLDPCVINDPGIANESAGLVTSQLERVGLLKSLARRLPPRLNAPTKSLVRKFMPYRHQQVQLSADDSRRIREVLRDDTMKLSREWGIDVTQWGMRPVSDGKDEI